MSLGHPMPKINDALKERGIGANLKEFKDQI